MKEIVALFKRSTVGNSQIGSVEEASRLTEEPIVVDEGTGTWRFGDGHKFSQWGSFKLGEGPTSEQQESRYWYPKVDVVFDRMDNAQLARAFDIMASQAFGSGYESGDAIDVD